MKPQHLGLPPRFVDWRHNQLDALIWAAEQDSRFVVLNMPTGSGKSLVYMALAALAEPDRVCVLTSARGLQDQLAHTRSGDFREMVVDVRGQSNYLCELEAPNPVTVEQGICHLGVQCLLKHHGCHYYDALRRAKYARVVVTNYSFWLHAQEHAEGIGQFRMLILDEAHEAPDELARFLAVKMDQQDIALVGKGNPPMEGWERWAADATPGMEQRLVNLQTRVPKQGRTPGGLSWDIRRYRSLVSRLKSLSAADAGWVMDTSEGGYQWDPVNVAARAESFLFRGVDKVLFTSATVRPKTLALLGVDSFAFREWPSTFSPNRRPVIWVPTVRMRHDGGQEMMRTWVNQIDRIVARRQNRKGIIHTVSYWRAKYLMEHSRFAPMMVSHTGASTRDVVARFKASKDPVILVSPSMGTGWDFPYKECEYQIVGKIAFPDNRSQVMQVRTKADKELSNYLAAVELVQTVGRGMRAEDDVCETLVIDDNIQWFLHRNRKFFPKWFLESFQKSEVVPAPLPLLEARHPKAVQVRMAFDTID